MPNWCSNSLCVSGDSEALEAFQTAVKKETTDLSLNALVPMPEELEETKSPSDEPNWYNWRCEH